MNLQQKIIRKKGEEKEFNPKKWPAEVIIIAKA